MKNKYLFCVLTLCMVLSAKATVLRVNNAVNSSAQFSTIEAALSAASSGDVIMVEASSVSYGDFAVEVPNVRIIGPGYWLQQNGITQEGGQAAETGIITVKADGVTLSGLYAKEIQIGVPNATPPITVKNAVVKRCRVGQVYIRDGSSNCVVTQNFITNVIGHDYGETYYHQITNNIITNANFRNINNSYIAYNSCLGSSKITIFSSDNNTFERNIWPKSDAPASCSFKDNLEANTTFSVYSNIDKDALSANQSQEHGAFAGDAPYVLSGVPSGPVIESLTAPTTAEEGSTISITVKVGVTK